MVRTATPRGGLDWAAIAGLLEPERQRPGRPGRGQRGEVGHLAAWVGRQQEGNRNAGLFWAACRAVEAATRRSWPRSRPRPARPGCPTGRSPRRSGRPAPRQAALLSIRAGGRPRHDLPAAKAAWPPGRQAGRPPDAAGTMWRLRSLVAMGHDSARIARALGVPPARAPGRPRRPAPSPSSSRPESTGQIYDAWWDKTPPRRTPAQRRAAARRCARPPATTGPPPRPRRGPARRARLPALVPVPARHRDGHRAGLPPGAAPPTPHKGDRMNASDGPGRPASSGQADLAPPAARHMGAEPGPGRAPASRVTWNPAVTSQPTPTGTGPLAAASKRGPACGWPTGPGGWPPSPPAPGRPARNRPTGPASPSWRPNRDGDAEPPRHDQSHHDRPGKA